MPLSLVPAKLQLLILNGLFSLQKHDDWYFYQNLHLFDNLPPKELCCLCCNLHLNRDLLDNWHKNWYKLFDLDLLQLHLKLYGELFYDWHEHWDMLFYLNVHLFLHFNVHLFLHFNVHLFLHFKVHLFLHFNIHLLLYLNENLSLKKHLNWCFPDLYFGHFHYPLNDNLNRHLDNLLDDNFDGYLDQFFDKDLNRYLSYYNLF